MKVKINVNLRVVSEITLIIILFISLKKLILNSCDCLNKDLNFKGNLNNHGVNGILPSKSYSCCFVLELRSKFLNADELTTELLCK